MSNIDRSSPGAGPIDFLVQWHLTERCNLRCRHCYQSGNGGDELSTAEALDVVDEVAETTAAWSREHGLDVVPSYSLTGGEPLLREDLFELLADLRGRGAGTFILTNGTLVDGEAARRLAHLAVRGVQVSLEGPESLHDSIRGKGSFSAAARGIRHLAEEGIPVTVNVTVSRLNASSLPGMVPLASSLGAVRLGFSRLIPAGRGAGLAGEMLTAEEVRDLHAGMSSMETGKMEVVSGDPLAGCLRSPLPAGEDAGDTLVGGCAAGLSGVTILPEGTLLPCRRLAVPLGNLRRDSLREIWATSPLLVRLRERKAYGGRCGPCSRWAICRGCRAVAWAASGGAEGGDPLADDPQCFLS